MIYADRAALKAAVRSLLSEDNQDVLSDSVIEDAIGFVEADLNWGTWGPFNKTFRLLEMQEVKRATILDDGEEYVTLPDGFITMRYVYVTTSSNKQALEYSAPNDFVGEPDSLPTYQRIYTISAGQIRLKPVMAAQDVLEMGYYTIVPCLLYTSDAADDTSEV